ncbi:uncharacterized protein [Ptychodera flava]|uniref:uncharacterized protein n=1 Tax=Ptychodera flava TaxID=63121 RepID=UPI00396A8802
MEIALAYGFVISLTAFFVQVTMSQNQSDNIVDILYKKYSRCRPGEEYGVRVSRHEIQSEDTEKYYSFAKQGKKKFYYCRRCSICGDGIKKTEECREGKDTKCGGCINEDYLYDPATKSCQPLSVIYGFEPVMKDAVADISKESFTSESDLQHIQKSTETEITDISLESRTQVTKEDQGATEKEHEKCDMVITTTDVEVKPYLIACIGLFSFLVVLIVTAIMIIVCRWHRRKVAKKSSNVPTQLV